MNVIINTCWTLSSTNWDRQRLVSLLWYSSNLQWTLCIEMEPQSELGSAINVFSVNFNVQLPFVMHIKYCWSEICLLNEVDSLNIYSSMILFEVLWPMMFCYQLGTIRGSSRSSTRLSFSNFISVTLWLVLIIKKPFMSPARL